MPILTANSDRRARIEDIAVRFTSRWHQGYARGKLKHDPVFDDAVEWARRAASAAAPAKILDVGCGIGLLAHWIRSHGVDIAVHGVDPDARKIAGALAAAKRGELAGVDFAIGNAQGTGRDFAGSVFLLDILHYLPLADRDALLAHAAANVPQGGVIYIRNGLRGDGWRHGVTRIEEWFVRLSGWIPTPGFRLPAEAEITRHFPTAKFESVVGALWGCTPFNSYRLAFVRR